MSVIYVESHGTLACVKDVEAFTEKVGFPPIMFADKRHCACSDKCLCQLDPFATARSLKIKLDIGDKNDPWTFLFVTSKPYTEYPEDIITIHTRSWGAYTPNDDRSNSLNPNNPACVASANNTSNQLNPNPPEFKDSASSTGKRTNW